MKTRAIQSFAVLFVVFVLFSCSEGLKKNPYLGRIPSIEKKYHGQILELVEGVQKSGDIANSLTLLGEFTRIETEWSHAINQEVAITDLSKAIPVDCPDGLPIRIQEASIVNVARNYLELRFNMEILDTIEDSRSLMVVYEALDRKGNPLEQTTSVASHFQQQRLMPGDEWSLTGLWETEAIINLENLDRIRVVRLEGMQ